MLTDEQKRVILGYLNEFRADHKIINNSVEHDYNDFDRIRLESLPEIRDLVDSYLKERISSIQFKEKSEELCRRYPYWGFKSFSGQMQLNQYINNIDDSRKESILRETIAIPGDIREAEKKINLITQYILELKHISLNPKSIPRPSLEYLLSYFWEIQSPHTWPIYYSSIKKVLLELGIPLDASRTKGEGYANFVKVMLAIVEFYKSDLNINEKYPLWFVEHVLWKQYMKNISSSTDAEIKSKKEKKTEANSKPLIKDISSDYLWLPPIIQDLEELAYNRPTDWSLKQGLKPEKAFETKLRYVFTLLGYDVTELGQGKGREPDGVAISIGLTEHYAIVYDAKAREDKYVVGTNDREMKEYIFNKVQELTKLRISKVYFMVISSRFDAGASNIGLIKNVYKQTRVPVVLITARDLMFLVENKLQDISIDHNQIEDLLLDTGLITREKITDILGK